MQEEWRAIVGYEGYYEVSNAGRVRSLARMVKHPQGGYVLLPEKILRGGMSGRVGKGYRTVLLWKEGGSKTWLVHRLVATAFLPNPYQKPQINHKDGVRTHNHVENLEWCTPQENMSHGYRLGLFPKENNPRREKLTQEEVVAIWQALLAGESSRQIRQRTAITQSMLWRIKHKKISKRFLPLEAFESQ
jgi:hypothetical protein